MCATFILIEKYSDWCGQKEVMVCQAAGQTKFRALKHENGIEGESTIIVRVIACFQPLHDCQVSVLLLILSVFQLQFFPITLGITMKLAV